MYSLTDFHVCIRQIAFPCSQLAINTKYKTCIYQAVSQSGSNRYISTNPGGCSADQVSTSRTSDPNSLLINMTAYGKLYVVYNVTK